MPFIDSKLSFAGMFAGILFASVVATQAHAQATRTWVSGVGDDANPCSRTAPCKTFAGAISKTAAGGEISVLDPGGFGAVTITKSITIDGNGVVASILASLTTGVIVNAANIVVTIRNVSISGAGNGINGVRFLQGRSLTLKNVVIENFTQEAVRFAPSTSADLVLDNVMLRASQFGVRTQPGTGATANALISDSMIEGNSSGGVRADDGSVVLVKNSVMHNNGTVGFNAVSATGGFVDAAVVNSVSSNNGANGFVAQVSAGAGSVAMLLTDSKSLQNTGDGVVSIGAATIRMSNNQVSRNGGTGINAAAGSILSAGNNLNQGNGVAGAPNGAFALQ